MGMSLNDARQIGEQKLRIDKALFLKALEAAKQMEVRPKDYGPMTLALAILGISKAHKSSDGLEAELTDALALVAQAEKEWRMEMIVGKGRA